MDFKISDDILQKVVERYDLTLEKSEDPGIYLDGEKLNVDQIISKLFNDEYLLDEDVNVPKQMSKSVTVNYTQEKYTFKNISKRFLPNHVGVL